MPLPADAVPKRLRLRIRRATFDDSVTFVRGEPIGQPEGPVRSFFDVMVGFGEAPAYADAFETLARDIRSAIEAVRASGVI